MSPHETSASAPAKVNLSLRVLHRRQDGYHELDGVMARLDLADTLACAELTADEAAAGADRLERIASGDDPWLDALHLPVDDGNLVLRAARAYRSAAAGVGVAVPPLRWRLTKRVPIAAGLGGGSSDAAAALRSLAARYPASIDLAALAASLGSDVPFFLEQAVAARARGRGERLEPWPVPPQPLVLVNPGVAVSAGAAYTWWRPGRAPAAATAPWWDGPEVANDLESGVAAHVPEVAATLDRMRSLCEGPVAMSGSGATCFALMPDETTAAALTETLRATLPPTTWIVRTRLAQRA